MPTSESLLLDPARYRRTPWKNGGGVTVDIADAYHPGAVAGDWTAMIWRFGRTRIEVPGPFSDLSGYDRHLAVIEGHGLRLHPAGQPVLEVRRPFEPVSFPGEWRIESELTAGPVGVLNLIADRRLADTSLSFHPTHSTMKLLAGIALIYAPAGSAGEVGNARFVLAPDETLRCERAAGETLYITSGQIVLATIRSR